MLDRDRLREALSNKPLMVCLHLFDPQIISGEGWIEPAWIVNTRGQHCTWCPRAMPSSCPRGDLRFPHRGSKAEDCLQAVDTDMWDLCERAIEHCAFTVLQAQLIGAAHTAYVSVIHFIVGCY